MLTSSLQDILDNKDLEWKEVGANQEIPSLDGYATTKYVDEKIAYLNSDVSSLNEKVNTAQTTAEGAQTTAYNAQTKANEAFELAEEAYDIAYTIAYTEGVDGVIDTIRDIAYWINEDPSGAVSLITRMTSAEEDIAYNAANISALEERVNGLTNYDDTAVKELIAGNTSKINNLESKTSYLESDLSDVEELVSYNISDIAALKESTQTNAGDIADIKESIAYIQSNGYDDSALRELIAYNASDIANNKEKIESMDLGDTSLWKASETGNALIVDSENKEILNIADYTKYIQSSCSLTWDKM
jgi:uncharacterized protein (UPF0335 family)